MANATIRVQFGGAAGASGHLSAEVDTRPDGLNAGKTSFAPGETAYILVFKSSNVTITNVACSAGSISQTGSTVVAVEEELMFEDADTATTGKPVRASIYSVKWMGRSLGGLALQPDKLTVKASGKGVAVAKVSYESDALVYALSSPESIEGETDFSILVLIKGEAA